MLNALIKINATAEVNLTYMAALSGS